MVLDVGAINFKQWLETELAMNLMDKLFDLGHPDVKISATRYTKKGNLVRQVSLGTDTPLCQQSLPSCAPSSPSPQHPEMRFWFLRIIGWGPFYRSQEAKFKKKNVIG